MACLDKKQEPIQWQEGTDIVNYIQETKGAVPTGNIQNQ
jgi:hypothetical protein